MIEKLNSISYLIFQKLDTTLIKLKAISLSIFLNFINTFATSGCRLAEYCI